MKHITCYFDFISPYAYLAFEHLPVALQGCSYSVAYTPVLFAGLLQHHGQLGPAEVAGKREWTYRHMLWQAHQHGIALHPPAAHPFNPLPLLRLAVACSATGQPNRYVCNSIFRHVWRSGADGTPQDAADPQRLAALTLQLQPGRDPGSAQVKAQLKTHTDQAIALGIFGVPTFAVDDQLFWGLDALPLLRAWIDGDPWFGTSGWHQAGDMPAGVQRIRGG
jgi:2-hydroxychromene-2-carboxylate isomerase